MGNVIQFPKNPSGLSVAPMQTRRRPARQTTEQFIQELAARAVAEGPHVAEWAPISLKYQIGKLLGHGGRPTA